MKPPSDHSYTVGLPRSLRPPERALLVAMLSAKPTTTHLLAELEGALVQAMNDGGMGSLRFWRESIDDRRFGGMPVVATFRDQDGTLVIASVYIDHTGNLFELDVWKVDFSALKRIPTPSEVEIDPPALRN